MSDPDGGMCGRWFGRDAAVPMAATDFLDALARDVPESQPVLVEHLEDNDGLLLHLLTADLRRFAIQSFDAGQNDSHATTHCDRCAHHIRVNAHRLRVHLTAA